MYVVENLVSTKKGRYSKKKREQSDAFLFSEHTKKHVAKAFLLKNEGYTYKDLTLIEPDKKQDINFGLDGEFYIPKKENLKITGRMGFRCRPYDKLAHCDLTITQGITNGQIGEFSKSRANTMLYGYENKSRDPYLGFSLFTIIDFQHVANLLKSYRLNARIIPKNRDDGNQMFLAVSFADLFSCDSLLYVGSDCIDAQVEKVAENIFPELVGQYLLKEGYWSFFKRHHQSL